MVEANIMKIKTIIIFVSAVLVLLGIILNVIRV